MAANPVQRVQPGEAPSRFGTGLAAFLFLALSACSGSLDVLVVSDPVTSTPVPGAHVTILGTSIAGIANTAGHAIFSLGPGTVKVRGLFIGMCPNTMDAVIVAGTTTHLTFPLCPAADRITVTGNASGVDAVIMLDAFIDAGGSSVCHNDLILLAPATAGVPGNAVPSSGGPPPCGSTATVFAKSLIPNVFRYRVTTDGARIDSYTPGD